MKNSRALPLALVAQLTAGTALAQGPSKDVTIYQFGGPHLGVRLDEVGADEVSRLGLKEEKGALVKEVVEGSAASKAGIRNDDVIVRFQGESILTAAQLSRLVRDVPAGRKVDIDLIRAGAPIKVTATLENRKWSGEGMDMKELAGLNDRLAEKMETLRFRSKEGGLPRTFDFKFNEEGPGGFAMTRSSRGRMGIGYTEIEGQLAAYFKAPTDRAILVNSVVQGSAAEKAGIKAGDLLLKLGGLKVADTSDLQEGVRNLEAGKSTPVSVWRDGRSVDLTITLDPIAQTRVQPRSPRRPIS